jgi:DNA-binding LacI/PurR family transcriptional regulator
MPTIKDVAKEAGVSIATVSYVINHKDDGVSETTRKQVWEAVARIGYQPNVTARNLQASQTKLIGYAWHRVQHGQVNALLDHFTYYLAQAAEAAGYHVLTFTHDTDNWESVYRDLIRTKRIDGFVLADTQYDDPRIRFLLEERFPFVSFGRANPNWDFVYVDTDGRQGVIDSVNYLVSLGHRRIAMIGWPEASSTGSYRLQGYQQAMQAAGLEVRPDYLWRGVHDFQTGSDAVAYWCRLPRSQRPTAVLAVSDIIAIGAMHGAQAHGLTVGRDLSVMGFDDVPLSQYLRPALTTVRQPIPEICQTLIQMFQSVINGETPKQRHVLMPPQLVVRDSCGAPLDESLNGHPRS